MEWKDKKDLLYRPHENAERCANKSMDDWEDQNLRPEDRRKPRLLCCGCSRCNPVSM